MCNTKHVWKIFPGVKESIVGVSRALQRVPGVQACPWVCITACFVIDSPVFTAEILNFWDQNMAFLSPTKRAQVQTEQVAVYFHLLISPKVSKNSSISFWSISFLLSASSFALSAFRIFISTRLCCLRCCPSFQCMSLISNCSSLFCCSRLFERQTWRIVFFPLMKL